MRITLSGNLGSGKSTVGRKLGAALGIPYKSTGQMFREIGQIRNLDALKTNLAAEDNVDIDHQVDEQTKRMDATVPDFILDSRMAWHFVRDAVRVFLSVSRETAATRIMGDTSRDSERYHSLAEAMTALDSRRASETLRYKRLYHVDIERDDNYDLHIVTDDADPDDVVKLIAAFVERRATQKYWMPKTRLVPLVAVSQVAAASVAGLNFGDANSLSLKVRDNFGFYDRDAATLLAFLRHESALVPYAREADAGDPLAEAIRRLKLADLRAWESAAGVRFAFATRLAAVLVPPDLAS